MGDEINSDDKARQYHWRPAVSPYRPPGFSRIRSRKPLPGQMVLPGMEAEEESAPTDQGVDAEGPPADSVQAHHGSQAGRPVPAHTCPNCGSNEFDEDGDCIHCWEPGVVRNDTRPKATEG